MHGIDIAIPIDELDIIPSAIGQSACDMCVIAIPVPLLVIVVKPRPALAGQTTPAEIDTFADHRIAMSFALAGLKLHGVTILDPACVGKTYPGYWRALASLGVRLEGDVP